MPYGGYKLNSSDNTETAFSVYMTYQHCFPQEAGLLHHTQMLQPFVS